MKKKETPEQRLKRLARMVIYNAKMKEKNKLYRQINKEKSDIKGKEYRIKNKEKILEKNRKWAELNKDSIILKRRELYLKDKEKYKKQSADYRKANKEKVAAAKHKYQVSKLANDPIFKLSRSIRNNIRMSFKQGKKPSRTTEILGCTTDEFRDHLSSKFEQWMTFENYGKWHLDHIIPISMSCQLSTDSEQIECIKLLCHYTNYQPLDAIVNTTIKNDNYVPYQLTTDTDI